MCEDVRLVTNEMVTNKHECYGPDQINTYVLHVRRVRRNVQTFSVDPGRHVCLIDLLYCRYVLSGQTLFRELCASLRN